ncbi:MAG: YkvA family protein [Pseudomonadota bacterium]|nr:YkvA family protein [Pseudomonadota bacterium]
MGLSINIELSDNDLDHFVEVLKRAHQAAGAVDSHKITDAARKLLEGASAAKVPEFISERLAKLEHLIDMVHDEGWGLQEEDKNRVLTALTYFADPQDVIPDSVPVVGYLDDAIMIELCVRELKHELEAYQDFCAYRVEQSAAHGTDVSTLGRAHWMDDRRQELQDRMRRRRDRDSYAAASSGGGLFRFR